MIIARKPPQEEKEALQGPGVCGQGWESPEEGCRGEGALQRDGEVGHTASTVALSVKSAGIAAGAVGTR